MRKTKKFKKILSDYKLALVNMISMRASYQLKKSNNQKVSRDSNKKKNKTAKKFQTRVDSFLTESCLACGIISFVP